MFFNKKSKPAYLEHFSKEYFALAVKKCSEDAEKMRNLLDMGITNHYDYGQIGEDYVDVVFLGPLRKELRFKATDILSSKNPAVTRYGLLKKEIKTWHDELLSLNSRLATKHGKG